MTQISMTFRYTTHRVKNLKLPIFVELIDRKKLASFANLLNGMCQMLKAI